MKENYIISHGTAYSAATPKSVIGILDNAINTGVKLRIWYGDKDTGRDWMEVHGVYGRIGRSTGTVKIPLLIKTSRSLGGGAICDDCIVKITSDKSVLYQHPKFYQPKFHIEEASDYLKSLGYQYSVFAGADIIRNCKTYKAAEREVAFHKGIRNVA